MGRPGYRLCARVTRRLLFSEYTTPHWLLAPRLPFLAISPAPMRHRSAIHLLCSLLFAGLLVGCTGTRHRPDGLIPGFGPSASAAQRELEQRFLAVPSSASAEQNVRQLARQPHLAGTPQGKEVAEWLAAQVKALGFETELVRYDVYLPHPSLVEVTLVVPEQRALMTREPVAPESPAHGSPTLWNWNAYSANGTVEAQVVYANYGLPDDYAALERLGQSVAGKIVLVRYGRGYRGVKVREAELRGAAGVLIYSEPGRVELAGDTLPDGPGRPSSAVQRGTVQYLWLYPGDPLTPGTAALPGALRLTPAEAGNLPRIPVAPLPYAEAAHIIATLGGPEAPSEFQGRPGSGYRVGPGPAVVRLNVEQEYALRPIWTVIARLPGRTPQEVVIGNHHDAWIFGGVDPHSGTAAVLEIARGLSALRSNGWTPRRGITLAFWDAEEFGVIGSTEWVEEQLVRLRENAIAYFNVDVFLAGTLDVSGSHSLRDLVLGAAESVRDPVTGGTLAEGWRARQPREPGAPLLGNVGAGSDWTAFLNYAGVPSLQWTMNGRGSYAVYHSVLDDFEYIRRFGDSAFVHTPAMASVMGLAALRLAEADALPFRYSHYAERIGDHLEALQRENAQPAGSTPARLDLDRLRTLVWEMRDAATRLEAEQERALIQADSASLERLNTRLPAIEQAFLDKEGLPGRPWYQHQIYGPGHDTGYDALPLPALAEALRAGDQVALDVAASRLEQVLEHGITALRAAMAP
jgi:N-acetylated-alpha-linked acidic dipeptidase